ncbi:MAG: sensor histidine kinase [Thermoleophilia bacterium]
MSSEVLVRSRRLSLRARLVIVTLAMVAVALAAAGWATHAALESFLVDRVDRELQSDQLAAGRRALGGDGPSGRPQLPGLPEGSIVQDDSGEGVVIGSTDERLRQGLPADLRFGFSTLSLAGREYRIFKASADGTPGGPGLPTVGIPGSWLAVAVPLSDVNDTLARLVWIELAVGAAALGGLALLGLWLVRLGLRPLDRIGATADAIAAGDLSQRVADDDPRTEVGRLGATLNSMLGRVEESFAARAEQERRLRRFVADASHELQTPLTSVRGYAELFRRGAAERPEDLQTTMRRIEAESARMGVLVDDLLLLARLDDGRPLERRRLDLAALAGEMAADARVVEPDRPIDADLEPAWVDGDDARLRQVVGNLLSNARAHTPAGAPVTVRVRERDGEATLEVADSGPGLEPEHAARVFERFFRADPSRARASGGSGLGLSIVTAIAEAHGGRAELDSEPGRGATFRVVLPAAGHDAGRTPPPDEADE